MIEPIPYVESLPGQLAVDYDCVAAMGRPCIGIRCGTAGTLRVVLATGATVDVRSVLASETLWFEATRIVAAGTTAEHLLVYWGNESSS
jgi:hypothetical protein